MQSTALILGVGVPDGVGGALARRFAAGGMHVVLGGRTLERVGETAQQVVDAGGSAEAVSVDVTSPEELDAAFAAAKATDLPLGAVIYNAGNNMPIAFEHLSADEFVDFWNVGCLGGFLTAQRAMPLLREQGHGSLLFTGASASLRGKPNFAHFAVAKAGLRNLAQALAREYGPQGVHVGHVIIDGIVNGERVKSRFEGYVEQLGEDGALDTEAVAEAFWTLHTQPRSAWTFELDLRPFKENW